MNTSTMRTRAKHLRENADALIAESKTKGDSAALHNEVIKQAEKMRAEANSIDTKANELESNEGL